MSARPPTRSLPSSMVVCQRPAPFDTNRLAAASPANPAPIMMTLLACLPAVWEAGPSMLYLHGAVL